MGAHLAVLTRGSGLRALASDPAQPARARQAGLLLCLCTGWRLARRTGWRGGAAPDDRGVLWARPRRPWARPRRGALPAWVAPAHKAVPCGGGSLWRGAGGLPAPFGAHPSWAIWGK